MIDKPLSVKLAGWVALVLFVALCAWALSGVVIYWRDSGDVGAGDMILVFLAAFFWWCFGTLLHRSRVNRMRYRGKEGL